MSRRVIPMGDSLKIPREGWGGLDRIGAAYSSDPICARRTHRYPALQGVTHESFTVLRRGPPCTDPS